VDGLEGAVSTEPAGLEDTHEPNVQRGVHRDDVSVVSLSVPSLIVSMMGLTGRSQFLVSIARRGTLTCFYHSTKQMMR
jgi:hypothetical protein